MGFPFALTALLLVVPQPKIAAMDIRPRDGVTPGLAQIITDAVAAELRKRFKGATVVGTDDLKTMIGFQAEKKKLGCQDTSCLSEIGGALGVDYLVTGTLAKLDTSYILNLKLIDARHARVIAADDERLKGKATEDLLDAAGLAVSALAEQAHDTLFPPPAPKPALVPPTPAVAAAPASPPVTIAATAETSSHPRPVAIALGVAGVIAGGFAVAGLAEALSFKGWQSQTPGATIPPSTVAGNINNANTWATVSLITGIAAVAGLGGAVITW